MTGTGADMPAVAERVVDALEAFVIALVRDQGSGEVADRLDFFRTRGELVGVLEGLMIDAGVEGGRGGGADTRPGDDRPVLPAPATAALPAGWGDPARPENAERITRWVWCPVVWAVLCDDPCVFDKQHDQDCECRSRFPLAVASDPDGQETHDV